MCFVADDDNGVSKCGLMVFDEICKPFKPSHNFFTCIYHERWVLPYYVLPHRKKTYVKRELFLPRSHCSKVKMSGKI